VEAVEIIKEVSRLPIKEKITVMEKILDSLRGDISKDNDLEIGAQTLLSEYKNNQELTVFTSIDADDFYETK
jgi:hypothetical protein